ncbi:uncharacterized protein LOC127169572 isoform X1 [Labeo rohita]|uniref:uncharacterized protein LOC127169572 isoform X1 n=1 Tax=Labeo rohita TaxID=84645 RepID=UPI0021E2202B|nr:uncharacterized protein LOC127169572 isoform X1 [Labeo rohita]XP_050973017.1 uncharacterized protein LOC127169572 isoform X1 [Labeo rohita]
MDCTQCGNGNADATVETEGNMNTAKEKHDEVVPVRKASWEPSVLSTIGKEIHYFAGYEISIWESLDSFGSVIWPAALALCHYLESNRATVDLVDKAVLEIGAGTALVSIVASLLGAWVTATDLPDVLGNLRSNLSRNTRGRCRYTPQVAELSWGYELDKTFPRSVYKYDYILAADVVYHHDFLAELLVTMRHFCQPGTTLIWANKIRFDSDLVFVENFKKAFNTTLLADNGEVKIYSATTREESGLGMAKETEEVARKGVDEKVNHKSKKEMNEGETKWTEQKYEKKDVQFREEQATGFVDQEETSKLEDGNLNSIKEEEDNTNCETEPVDSGDEDNDSSCETDSTFVEQKSEGTTENDKQQYTRSWAPTIYYRPGKEVYNFLDQEIIIQESIDSYGATIWPAALALCRFLETPQGRQRIDLLDKSVLELGAGTGLLSVVVTLLGAKLTATDLPEILSNLTYNLNRNTRGRRRHEPLIAELYWGHKLDENFPKSTHHYDYVLATDVVYHHDFLAELLVTMRHFCQPGTTLVWANKVRYASDLGFIDNFLRYFEITLLEELDDVRIYIATCKTSEQEGHQVQEMNEEEEDLESSKQDTGEPNSTSKIVEHLECDDTQSLENEMDEAQVDEELQDLGRPAEEEEEAVPAKKEPTERSSWAPAVYCRLGKEIYYFLGYEIKIQEGIDNYGGVVWPAALALCRFLDTPAGREQINLFDKSTLELGAGTGLVSIIATLLGAKLTATDLPEILGNLTCNLNRNTRWKRRHEPQVTALTWGYKLEETFPHSTHHYDYVLAADAVYHHDCLSELLETMSYFCQKGTTVIFANKVRYQSDVVFIENFHKAFNATLLTELDEVRIYSATMRI